MTPAKTPVMLISAVVFPLFIISVSALSVSFDSLLFDKEFSRLGTYDLFGRENVLAINGEVLSYLRGEQPSIGTPFFNGREKAHLADVRALFRGMMAFAFLSAIFFIFLFLFSKERRRAAAGILFAGSLALVGIMAFAGAAVLLDFGSSFSAFHVALFTGGTYLFDPATENIVNLYPEELFSSFAQKVALLSSVLGLLGLFGGWCMKPRNGRAEAKVRDGQPFSRLRFVAPPKTLTEKRPAKRAEERIWPGGGGLFRGKRAQ